MIAIFAPSQMDEYNREITACFTGHRTYDGSCNEALQEAVRELYARGYRIFLCGMAVGFDLAAAEVALSLRDELRDMKIVAVVPFEGMQQRFSRSQRALFERVMHEADEVITLALKYSASVYMMRNNFLVDNSSAVVAYFTGKKGGTAYTVHRAVKGLCRIVNIYNNPQRELF